jgi:hypothetical protein
MAGGGNIGMKRFHRKRIQIYEYLQPIFLYRVHLPKSMAGGSKRKKSEPGKCERS